MALRNQTASTEVMHAGVYVAAALLLNEISTLLEKEGKKRDLYG
jgi:hypothetical protein